MKFLQLYVVALYCIELLFSLMVFIRFVPYFTNRFRSGAVGVFKFSVWAFLGCYATMSLAGLIFRFCEWLGYGQTSTITFLAYLFWAITHTGCALAMATIARMTIKNSYDFYITTKGGPNRVRNFTDR